MPTGNRLKKGDEELKIKPWYQLEKNQTPEKLLDLAKTEKKRIEFYSKIDVTEDLKNKYPHTFGRYDKKIILDKSMTDLVERVLQNSSRLNKFDKKIIGEMEEMIHKYITVLFRTLKLLAIMEEYEDADNWP